MRLFARLTFTVPKYTPSELEGVVQPNTTSGQIASYLLGKLLGEYDKNETPKRLYIQLIWPSSGVT